jgi:hypothetical protein
MCGPYNASDYHICGLAGNQAAKVFDGYLMATFDDPKLADSNA